MWTASSEQSDGQSMIDIKEELPDVDSDEGPTLSSNESEETQSSNLVEPKPETSKRKRTFAKRVTYDASSIEVILNQVRCGLLTVNQAAKVSGIPRTTLQYRNGNTYKNKGSPGPYAVFNQQEEDEIIKSLQELEQRGFPLTHRNLRLKVRDYLKIHPRNNPFKDNLPGNSWVKAFLKRNPDLKLQTQTTDSKLSEAVTRSWFQNVTRFLKKKGLTHILSDPSRVLNGEIMSFMLNYKGLCRVKDSTPDIANAMPTMTVLFSFSADGSYFPTMLSAQEAILTRNVRKWFPDDWDIGSSKNPWVDGRNLESYITKTLRPAILKKGTELPVLYFISGGAAVEAAEMCQQYGIILISTFPYARQMFQNADTAAYKVLKKTWDQSTATWHSKNRNQKIKISVFGPLFANAVETSFSESIIKQGFSIRGLYPFDPNTIDYSKSCDNGTFIEQFLSIEDGDSEDEREKEKERIQIPQNILETTLQMLGPSKINMYLTESANHLSHEDKILSYIYKNILVPAKSVRNVATVPSSNNPISNNVSFENVLIKTKEVSTNDAEKLGENKHEGDDDHDDSNHCTSPKQLKISSKNCQMNEVDSSNPTPKEANCFAKEHICSFPRVTAHFCKAVSKVKYLACFMDVTGMYLAYINQCVTAGREPVTSKVYNSLLQTERANDPKFPTSCFECQHVEKFDTSGMECEFLKS
ncbi:uncharacterized protein LOC134211025 [Armigeres subalbatus]|uniref:uncharacterized protein LOC134211025 n=1 Tax=Armigeres subalbatus TaxID=124917 RepID=UPI002ED54ED2